MVRFKHLGLVAMCFVAGFLITGASCPFAGPSTPEVLFFMLGVTFAWHVMVAIGVLFVSRFSRISVTVITLLCLTVPIMFAGIAIKERIHLRYYAVKDRFRDYLADPIPASVRNLRFNTLEESIKTDLDFRFEIDPGQLERMIKSKGFTKVEPDEMRCPTDLFKDPAYLPFAGSYVLYQAEDPYGEVLTLKVNEAHTTVVFRKESSSFYRDRGWDGESHTRALKELEERKATGPVGAK